MNLPSGWRSLTPHELVGEDKSRLVIGPFGSSLKTSDYRPEGVPLVFVRDIRNSAFQSPRAFVSEEKAEQLRSHITLPGDVLITKMGEPPGDAAVYSGRGPAVITADCIRLRPTEDFDARFIGYAIQAPAIKRQVEFITNGIAQRKVSLSRFRTGLSIPVPPLDEQRRIVDLLENHLSRLEAATSYLDAGRLRLDLLEQIALANCRDGETRLLAEVTAIQGGIQKQPKRTPKDNAHPFLRVANVTANGLDLIDVHSIELFNGELERLRLQPGDLLVVEGNGSASQIGRAALWDGSIADCVHQNHLIRVRPLAGLLPTYLEAVWNSPQNRSILTDVASSSSGLHTLSVSKLKALAIPVPTVERQRELVARVDEVREARARLARAVGETSSQKSALRRSLLAAAFSGRLIGATSDVTGTQEVEELAGV